MRAWGELGAWRGSLVLRFERAARLLESGRDGREEGQGKELTTGEKARLGLAVQVHLQLLSIP